ncbi:MAG: hypothetical protein F4X36_13520 [Gammaproteobacteria bacterium]|nr:hypothetical protein [Gammaproteobacteria bacterium]
MAVPEEAHAAATPMIAAMGLDGADPTPYLERLRDAYPDESVTRHFERVWNDIFRRASITVAEAATAAPRPGGGWGMARPRTRIA